MTEQQSTGKGRPTPKRTQKARGPVVTPPTNRREAAKALRAKQAEQRGKVKAGYAKGDDAVLLPRDQGPARRMARDFVDGRRNLLTLLLPVALLVIVVGLTKNRAAQQATFGMWLATLAAAVLDGALVAFLLRKQLKEAFPGARARGHVVYALLRATSLRRLRKPLPQVSPAGLSFKK